MNKEKLAFDIRSEIDKSVKQRKEWLKRMKQAYGVLHHIQHLPDLPDGFEIKEADKTSRGFTLEIQYPYNKNLRGQIIDLMTASGFVKYGEVSESSINNTWNDPKMMFSKALSNELNFYVEFKFNDAMKNSTCRRVKVSEVLQRVPVYDWLCPEAESEISQPSQEVSHADDSGQ